MTGRRLFGCLLALSFLGLGNWSNVSAADAKPVPCPYAVAHDAPLNATEAVVADAEDHVQYRVEFNGIKGDRVPAFVYVPKKGPAKKPAALLQYGSGGSKKTDYIVEIGRQFVRRGFVAMTIDSPGRGERKGKKREAVPGGEEWRDVFLQYLGDYSRAVDYLVSRPDVDQDRVGFLGISYGAITGIPYVAHDPRIKAMISMVGGAGFIERLTLSNNDRVKELARQVDPLYHVPLIAPRPLLLLNVTKDELIPRPAAEALHKAAGPGSKIIWMETTHYFKGIDRNDLAATLTSFLLENLPAKPAEKKQ